MYIGQEPTLLPLLELAFRSESNGQLPWHRPQPFWNNKRRMPPFNSWLNQSGVDILLVTLLPTYSYIVPIEQLRYTYRLGTLLA